MNNKITSFLLIFSLILLGNVFSNDEEKIAAIFKETHEQVQEILKSEKIKEDRKYFAIQNALELGKSKLNTIRSFYVQRQLFKDADKIKEVIAKFEATDFKAQTLFGKNEPEKKPEIKENETTPAETRTNTFYDNNINYLYLDQKSKDAIAKKLIKPNGSNLSMIETDHFKIIGNVKSDFMVKFALNFEWNAKVYLELFRPAKKAPSTKMEVYLFNTLDASRSTLTLMNITLNDNYNGNEYFDRKSNTMWYFREGNPRSINPNTLRSLAKNYGEPFNDRSPNINCLEHISEHAPITVVRKEVVFSYLMSQNRNSKLIESIINDSEELKKKLSDGTANIDLHYLYQLSILYFINNGDHENLNTLIIKEGQNYFRVPARGALINILKQFLDTELPLARDYCANLMWSLKNQTSQYQSQKENDDKIIIVDAKYSTLPMAKYYKGIHYFLSNNADESNKNLQELNDNLTKYPYTHSMLAVNYKKLGKTTEALKHKALALKEHPQDPVINNNSNLFK